MTEQRTTKQTTDKTEPELVINWIAVRYAFDTPTDFGTVALLITVFIYGTKAFRLHQNDTQNFIDESNVQEYAESFMTMLSVSGLGITLTPIQHAAGTKH